jgi:hypothetical protein
MTDSFVTVLKERRDQLMADIEALRAQTSELAGRITTKESQLRNINDLLAIEDGSTSGPPSAAEPVASRSQKFLDAAYDVLDQSGQPIHYRSLAARLGEEGVHVPGQDPAANLLAHMSRDPRFGRAGARGMYGLSTWPSLTVHRRRSPRKTSRPKAASRRKRASAKVGPDR